MPHVENSMSHRIAATSYVQNVASKIWMVFWVISNANVTAHNLQFMVQWYVVQCALLKSKLTTKAESRAQKSKRAK